MNEGDATTWEAFASRRRRAWRAMRTSPTARLADWCSSDGRARCIRQREIIVTGLVPCDPLSSAQTPFTSSRLTGAAPVIMGRCRMSWVSRQYHHLRCPCLPDGDLGAVSRNHLIAFDEILRHANRLNPAPRTSKDTSLDAPRPSRPACAARTFASIGLAVLERPHPQPQPRRWRCCSGHCGAPVSARRPGGYAGRGPSALSAELSRPLSAARASSQPENARRKRDNSRCGLRPDLLPGA